MFQCSREYIKPVPLVIRRNSWPICRVLGSTHRRGVQRLSSEATVGLEALEEEGALAKPGLRDQNVID